MIDVWFLWVSLDELEYYQLVHCQNDADAWIVENRQRQRTKISAIARSAVHEDTYTDIRDTVRIQEPRL